MKKASRASGSEEASPHKLVAEELETLRKTFRTICQRYAEHTEQEIVALREKVLATSVDHRQNPKELDKPVRSGTSATANASRTRACGTC